MRKAKVAAAPITWGVSELPEWGYRLPPDRVLREMRDVGFEATELGPPGYLPSAPHTRRELLERYGLRLVAGFLAVVLHDKPARALETVDTEATSLAGSGAEVLVLAAALSERDYDQARKLSRTEWSQLGAALVAARDLAAAHGLAFALHPHIGTAVQKPEEVARVLDTDGIDLCLDTGHLFLGGTDPVQLLGEARDRVSHVHLKDVDGGIARSFQEGQLPYSEAVRRGMFRPLGQGDLDIAAVCDQLQAAGYEGWFVLEQDTALTAEPEPGRGPSAAAGQSLDYFRRICGAEQHITASEEQR